MQIVGKVFRVIHHEYFNMEMKRQNMMLAFIWIYSLIPLWLPKKSTQHDLMIN